MATAAWIAHPHAPNSVADNSVKATGSIPSLSRTIRRRSPVLHPANLLKNKKTRPSTKVYAKANGIPQETQEILLRVRQFDNLNKLAATFKCTIEDWKEANPELKNVNQIYEGKFLRIPSNAWNGVVPDGYQGRIQAHRVPSFLKNKTGDEIARLSVHAEDLSNHEESSASVGILPILFGTGPEALSNKRAAAVFALGTFLFAGGLLWAAKALFGKKTPQIEKTVASSKNGSFYSNGGVSSRHSTNGSTTKSPEDFPVTVLGQLEALGLPLPSGVEIPEASKPAEKEFIPISPPKPEPVLASVQTVEEKEKLTNRENKPLSVSAVVTPLPAVQDLPKDSQVQEVPVIKAKIVAESESTAKPSFLASVFGGFNQKTLEVEAESRNGSSTSSGVDQTVVTVEATEAVEKEELSYLEKKINAAIPAIAVGAGIAATVTSGYEGAFEIMGLTAVASFATSDLLLAAKRKEFVQDLLAVRSHKDLIEFMKKRDILPKA